MKFKKITAIILAAVSLTAILSSCNGKQSNGKIEISIGQWPLETKPETLERYNKMKEDFMLQHENVNLTPDTYVYDTKTFTMKASANQLPTMYRPWFTDIKQIIRQGYAADITKEAKEHGYDKAINPELLELVMSDGKIYGLPMSAYAQGLYINKEIFKEAGLVNSDGSIMVPQTYQEVAEFSKIIKDKTGNAGIVIPTTNNAGGWQFLNIAWSYGVEFCKQREDGTWEATFNTQEARDALQYYKDLKWRYNALVDDAVITQDDIYKYFGSAQGGMMIANPPISFEAKYGLDNDVLFVTKMPEGPKGRYTQMGGNVWMFAANATHEQIDACMDWLEFTGFSPSITDEQLEQSRNEYEQTIEEKGVVLDQEAFDIWVNEENITKKRALRAEYANVDHADYEQYYSFEGVTIKPEPAACAQQLYSILDGCIQEVITNENADVAKLIETANNDYQVNHLDKM